MMNDLATSSPSLPLYYIGLNAHQARGRSIITANPREIRKIPMTQFPREHADYFAFSLDVSGVAQEDIAVVVDGNQLIVEIEKDFDPHRVATSSWDKSFGIFTRRFEIPDSVGPALIRYRRVDSQLNLTLFKKEVSAQAAPTQEKGDPSPQPPEPRIVSPST